MNDHKERAMPDLTPNHPAVEAANMGVQEWLAGDGPFDDDPVRLAHDMTAACITAALPHLTADDLRNTPAGRALMAEAWAHATFWERYPAFRRAQDAEEGDA